MPAKNAGKFIQQSARSALEALPKDAELVILDDGSSDNTVMEIESINDARLRLVSSTASLGVAAGANLLFEQSDSEYVARIDADDLCVRNRFTKQLQQIENNDLVFSRIRYISADGQSKGIEKFLPVHHDAAALHLLLGNIFSNPTMFARRSALSLVGGFRPAASEDYDLWLRAARADLRMAKTYSPLVKYRLHKDQTTASGDWQANNVDSYFLESYASLISHTLGISVEFQPQFVANLSVPHSMLSEESEAAFRAAFRERVRHLPLPEQLFLRARMQILDSLLVRNN